MNTEFTKSDQWKEITLVFLIIMLGVGILGYFLVIKKNTDPPDDPPMPSEPDVPVVVPPPSS